MIICHLECSTFLISDTEEINMTEEKRKRLRELNKKNEEFNKKLYSDARSYAKALFLLSLLALLTLIF